MKDSRDVRLSDLLIDAHVHVHPGFETTAFFDSSSANFGRGAEGLERAPAFTGCLLLTESVGEHRFAEFVEAAGRRGDGPWQFAATGEECSVVARRGPQSILVVAGRQIVTREGLEVLALGTTSTFSDGLELTRAIELTRASGALPVIPWGFGKWWLERGRIVREAVESAGQGEIFLGDNSGRLRWTPRPAIFDWATARDVLVLPGSDPLPFPTQVSKPGSYGFVLRCAMDEQRPAESIKDQLRAQREQPVTYGRRERLGNFLKNQVAMQFVKRRRTSASRGRSVGET